MYVKMAAQNPKNKLGIWRLWSQFRKESQSFKFYVANIFVSYMRS